MLPTFDESAVAKDIEAVCSKCGESWHVIVAVADGKIAQVGLPSIKRHIPQILSLLMWKVVTPIIYV